MRTLVGICLALMLVGCGRAGNSLRWPTHVDSIQGFDDAGTTKMKTYLAALNTNLGSAAINVDGTQGSPITIKMVTDFNSSSVGAEQIPSSTGLKIAGRATITDDHCTIEIGQFIVTDSNQDLFEPVLWHELGHCAGLTHVASTEQIMSPTTVVWESYTKDALNTFISAFLGSAGLATHTAAVDAD